MIKFEYGGLHSVISGGQTGADTGALLAAWRYRVQTGGQAPRGYKVAGGYNPLLEVLNLSAGGDYAGRTLANIQAADGTIVFAYDLKSPGTALTRRLCKQLGCPYLEIELDLYGDFKVAEAVEEVCSFIISNGIQTLNVAGNREVEISGLPPSPVCKLTSTILQLVFLELSTKNLLIQTDK